MALSSIALTTVAKARASLNLNPSDPQFQAAAIDIYHDQSVSATAATVQVTDTTIILIITGGANAGTTTLTLADAANDTVDELVGVINALATGWVAQALYIGDADTGDLVIVASASAYGESARQTLQIVSVRQMELIIEGVTDEIESWLLDGILTRDYNEIYYFDPIEQLTEFALKKKNVTGVERLALASLAAMRVEYTGTGTHARVEVTDTAVITRSRLGATTTTTTSTFASNVSIAEMVTTIAALTGWAATTVVDGPSAYLVREGVRVAKDLEVTLAAWDDFTGNYSVDYPAGIITLRDFAWPWAAVDRGFLGRGLDNQILVDFTAGLSATPDDVDRVALDMVVAEWMARGRDPALQSQSLEDYSYSLRADSAQIKEWRDRIETYGRTTN